MRNFWYILILTLPLTSYSIQPELLRTGGQLSVIFVILLWITYQVNSLYRGRFELPIDRGTKYFLLFVLVCFFSILYALNSPVQEYRGEVLWLKSLKQFFQLLISGSIYLLTPYFVRDRQQLTRTLKAWIAAYVIVLVYGLLELMSWVWSSEYLIAVLHLFHPLGVTPTAETHRLRLLSPEPSYAANYLLSILPFLLVESNLIQSRLWSRILGGLGVLLFIFTFSVGGYVALFAVTLAALAYLTRSVWRPAAYVTAILLVLVLIPSTRSRMEEVYGRVSHASEDFSIRARVADVSSGFNTFLSSPILGVGLGNSLFYFDRDYPLWALHDEYINYLLKGSARGEFDLALTNLPVRILAETGILGFVFFFLWHLQIAKTGLWSLKHSLNARDRKLSLAILLAAAALVTHYISTAGFHTRYLFFVFGLLTAWRNILSAEEKCALCPNPSARIVPIVSPRARRRIREGCCS